MRPILYLVFWCGVAACSAPGPQKSEQTPVVSNLTAIDTPAEEGSNLPYLVKGANDNLHLSWVEQRSDTTVLKYSILQEEGWSSPEEVQRGTNWFVNWADYPMVSTNQEGAMLAHFLAKSAESTYSYDVHLTRKPQREKWTEPMIPHKDGTPTEHGFVTMLPLGEGAFQVAWLDGRNTSSGHGEHRGAMTIRTAILDREGNLSDETELDDRVCDCCQTGGTITANGPVFVYRDRSMMEMRDMSIVRKVNGQWTEPATIYNDHWKIEGCPVNGPRADAIGNSLAVAWFSAPGNNGQVKVIFSDDGGASFKHPLLIDNQSPLGRVDIAMLEESKAVVSWLTSEEDKSVIKAQVVYANGTSELPFNVAETNAARGSGFPQLAVHQNKVYFAWTQAGEGEEQSQIKLAALEL